MLIESFFDGKVIVKVGDITEEGVDAIVNAANSTLRGGGGVDGAIHGKGGPKILEECLEIRRTLYPEGLPTGEAVITSGGELPARYVIHTVGPTYGIHQGEEAVLLGRCYENSLLVAVSKGLASISFPSISTGVYAYPKHEAAKVASSTIAAFLKNESTISQINLVFFLESDAEIFLKHTTF